MKIDYREVERALAMEFAGQFATPQRMRQIEQCASAMIGRPASIVLDPRGNVPIICPRIGTLDLTAYRIAPHEL